jgi:hypothetical protein
MQAPLISAPTRDLLTEFKRKLQNDWKHETSCGRYVFNTPDLLAWMNRKDTGRKVSHAGALLNIIQSRRPTENNLVFKKIDALRMLGHNNEPFVLVFAILLSIDQGHLIECFYNARIFDKNLVSLPTNSREKLENELKQTNFDDFQVDMFEKAKWPFFLAPL